MRPPLPASLRILPPLTLGLFCALAAGAALPGASAPPREPRVVAVGDIHGDYARFVAILTETGLVDDRLRWTGGNTVLVQTGDFLDRGARVRDVMDLLMALEADARRAGGRVLTLIGNHEAMNLVGQTRDVSPAAYTAFVDGRSERRREEGYRRYTRLAGGRESAGDSLSRDEWLARHPPGFIEYRDAFGPSGRYGRWLRGLPVLARVGDTVFLHGGLHPATSGTLEEINARWRHEMAEFDRYQRHMVRRELVLPFFVFRDLVDALNAEADAYTAVLAAPREPESVAAARRFDAQHLAVLRGLLGANEWMAIDPESPLWYRGFATWPDDEGEALLEPLLERFDAARFVVGHTIPASRRITSRFDGRILLIDTGMLSTAYPGGRASALELRDGRMTAIYLDGRESF